MKKIIACLFLSFIFVTGLFANNDVQFRFIPYYESSIGYSFLPVNLEVHTYFNEAETIGIGFAIDDCIPMNTLNALVGIDFWLPIGKRAKLQFISGLNFCRFNESNSKGEIAETGINIENYNKAFGFGWGNDVQFKFKADKRCSFIIGLTFSAGLGKETRSQEPSSKDTNTTFIPIVNTKNIDVFNSIPYIGLSVNF